MIFFLILSAVWLVVVLYQARKPLPGGLDFTGPVRSVGWNEVNFFSDRTDRHKLSGDTRNRRQIFEYAYQMIEQAEEWIVADFFLINDWAGETVMDDGKTPLSQEFIEALIAKKSEHPEVQIVLISDPLNTVYGAKEQPLFQRAEEAGITVVLADLRVLRDSNFVYSPFWRSFLQWWGSPEGSLVPNPIGPGSIGLPALLEMLNFKANHRKVLTVDNPKASLGIKAMVTSANPHSASAMHSNVAVTLSGAPALDLLKTEQAVYRMTTGNDFTGTIGEVLATEVPLEAGTESNLPTETLQLQVLTERAIKNVILDKIEESGQGDSIHLAMFYFSDMDLAAALIQAQKRGALVQVLLDPNKDAFGRPKNGIPNRQVAARLHKGGVEVRWYQTEGEQFHSKMVLFQGADDTSSLIIGSANWTRRNLDNYNLETNMAITGSSDAPVFIDANKYFLEAWRLPHEWPSDEQDIFVTAVEYEAYEDMSLHRKILYWIMERSGASTF